MPITKRDVEAIPPNTIVWDQGRGSVAGFGVRRQRRDAVFVLKFSRAGRSRWFTIGKFGAPWTVEAARNEAKRLLGEVAAGNDPGVEKQLIKRAAAPTTISEMCDRYIETSRSGGILTRFKRPKKASTLAIDVGRVERHIKPLIGSCPVVDLDRRAVRQMIADIAGGKTATDEKTTLRGRAIVKGGQTTAARVADLLSGIMAWALEEGYVEHNPVHGVRRYRAEPRQRFLSGSELNALGKVIETDSSSVHPYALKIIQLLALTGCRLGEVASLRWREVDFENGCLRLLDTKTGLSMRAIGEPVLNILRAHSQQVGSEFVFPASRGDGAYQGTKRLAKSIFETANVSDATCHTLRHTFASVASGLGYSDATIGGLLGHAGRGVTSRYVHRPDEALKLAADAVCVSISGLMSQARPSPQIGAPAKVSPSKPSG